MEIPALLVNCSYFKQQSAAIMKLSTSSNLGVICTECVYLLTVYTVYVGILIMEFLFISTHSEPILNDHVLLLPENVHVSRSLLCMETSFEHGFIPVPCVHPCWVCAHALWVGLKKPTLHNISPRNSFIGS